MPIILINPQTEGLKNRNEIWLVAQRHSFLLPVELRAQLFRSCAAIHLASTDFYASPHSGPLTPPSALFNRPNHKTRSRAMCEWFLSRWSNPTATRGKCGPPDRRTPSLSSWSPVCSTPAGPWQRTPSNGSSLTRWLLGSPPTSHPGTAGIALRKAGSSPIFSEILWHSAAARFRSFCQFGTYRQFSLENRYFDHSWSNSRTCTLWTLRFDHLSPKPFRLAVSFPRPGSRQ